MTDLPARYDAMCRAIDAAYEVDEVKDIRDRAKALEVYARQAHNVENERRACEIRLRAERKVGQLLRSMEKNKGGRPRKTSPIVGKVSPAAEVGISKKQSENWQKLADIPQEDFEDALADPDKIPTTNGVIAATTPKPVVVPVSDDALWLCGRLKDFERNGLLTKTPAEVLLTMVPTMLDEVHRLAPKVAAWLRQIGEVHEGGEQTRRDHHADHRPATDGIEDQSELDRH